MKVLIVDIETTVQISQEIDEEENKKKKIKDGSPHNPDNKLVSANWRRLELSFNLDGSFTYTLGENNHSTFYHNDKPIPDSPEYLQEALTWADVFVAHNSKFDVMWLQESGFKLPSRVFCTYICEYILARGTPVELSLDETAKRREVTHKKADIISEYWDNDIGFEAMPLPIVQDYADADVLSCAEIYIEQLKDLTKPENLSLNNIVELMNDMLWFIVAIERNGVAIDLERLEEIDKQYEAEQKQLVKEMTELAQHVMGDTPFSLTSGVDISKILYSREVVDRELHKRTFNIGVDHRGKALRPPYMTDNQFSNAVRTTTRKIYRTVAEQCYTCHGKGKTYKIKKDGNAFAKPFTCKACGGSGFLYIPTQAIAGFKLIPRGPDMASINGFVADKTVMDGLIAQATSKGNLDAAAFLTKKRRLNAINTYRNSFVKGIRRWVRADGLLHPSFNQCITATGRLSSTNPNGQNMPKSKKFPVRSAFVSRFDNGEIIECDFSGLEFVIAGELSRDPQIIEDILNGKDIHRQTASIVLQKDKDEVTKDERNSVKPETFKPLYGGVGDANTPPHIKRYYDEFFNIYKGHKHWQQQQMEAALKYGKISTPSGRQLAFPGTRRIRGGNTTNATRIKNYPIQSFATADIVPLACIRVLRKFRELGLKSKLVLTIHDSAVADVYPGEREKVCEAFKWAFTLCDEEILSRWGHKMVLPLKAEISVGPDWMNLEPIH